MQVHLIEKTTTGLGCLHALMWRGLENGDHSIILERWTGNSPCVEKVYTQKIFYESKYQKGFRSPAV